MPPKWSKRNLEDLLEVVRHCNQSKLILLDKMFVIVIGHFRCPFLLFCMKQDYDFVAQWNFNITCTLSRVFLTFLAR